MHKKYKPNYYCRLAWKHSPNFSASKRVFSPVNYNQWSGKCSIDTFPWNLQMSIKLLYFTLQIIYFLFNTLKNDLIELLKNIFMCEEILTVLHFWVRLWMHMLNFVYLFHSITLIDNILNVHVVTTFIFHYHVFLFISYESK